MVYAVKKWSPYLIGRYFKIYIDHFSLKHMLDQRISTHMQQKWLSKMIGYDFKIHHRSGNENKAANALSRMNKSVEKATMMAISFPLVEWVEQLTQVWQQDMEIQRLIHEIQANPTSHSKYSWDHDLLKYKGTPRLGKNSSLKPILLKKAHPCVKGRHSSVKKTLERIGRVFIGRRCVKRLAYLWKNMRYVKEIRMKMFLISNCYNHYLSQVWTDISMDFIEGFVGIFLSLHLMQSTAECKKKKKKNRKISSMDLLESFKSK